MRNGRRQRSYYQMKECHIYRTKSLDYTSVETSKPAHHYFQTIQPPARDRILLQNTKILSTKPHHTYHILKKSNQSQLHPDVKRVKVPISSWSWKPLIPSLQDWTRPAQDSQFLSGPLEAHNMHVLSVCTSVP